MERRTRQWRLELDVTGDLAALDQALGLKRDLWMSFSGRSGQLPNGLAVTRSGSRLWVYADDGRMLRQGRRAVMSAIEKLDVVCTATVSQWSDELDRWLQTDPPLKDGIAASQDSAMRTAEEITTKTLTARAGKGIDSTFEQIMRDRAAHLGLQCLVTEDAGVVTNELTFEITGPRHQIDEFEHFMLEWTTRSIHRADSFDGPGP